MKKGNKGITLIALVITIIVMLILVGVTISMAVNGGLFDYAGKAAKQTKDAMKEEEQLAEGGIEVGNVLYNSIDEYLIASGNKVETENSDPLAGVWVFNSGEAVESLGISGDIVVNFECNGKNFIKVSIYGASVQFWGSNLEFVEAASMSGGVLCWNDNISISITDTYDETTHEELLNFLSNNAKR